MVAGIRPEADMADTLDRSTRAAGTSPFLWVLVLVVLGIVVLWALGAWGANEAVSEPEEGGQPIGALGTGVSDAPAR
jgi:hypothetical protein